MNIDSIDFFEEMDNVDLDFSGTTDDDDMKFSKEVENDCNQELDDFMTVKCPMCKNKYNLMMAKSRNGDPVCPTCGC